MTPVAVISLADLDRVVEQMAKGMDPIAYHTYKDAGALPRGYEWRRNSAESKARAALKALGVTAKKK